MVMEMSSLGLLHSWSSSEFLDEVPPLLHQVCTDVSRYLNVPSPNCGSNLTKGLNNLSDSNKLVHSSANLGSNLVKGGVVEHKLNANISNCSYLLKRKKAYFIQHLNAKISYEMVENLILNAQLGATGVPPQVSPFPRMYPLPSLMDVIIQP
ncbi:hypothetical protein R3W88_011806 [Solanum pinnatisectum]|uniref:Uncharacterized protein n=1 Tax=Solanum pinnatisectum TaxID=50273 RepID=A0AAV9L8J0_9SOLN|nr:hypothetical protein R3W88_011806 [Solanum pinnatisectum]